MGLPLATRVRFGDAPDHWGRALRVQGPFVLLVVPLIYVGALTQMAAPLSVFRWDTAPGAALVSWLGTSILVLLWLAATILILRRRAAGVFLLTLALVYGGPMVAAVMIAAVPIGSLTLVAGTLALALWSLMGLRAVNTRVTPHQIEAIRRERIDHVDGLPHLIPASRIEGGGMTNTALRGLRPAWATLLEYAGVLLVAGTGLVLLPVSIASDFGARSVIAPVLWFVCTALFLGGRGSINTWLLLLRAMAAEEAGPKRLDHG